MLGRIVRNPILKGIRVRNKKMSRRINKTGRRRSVDAPPEERLERNCPHLAFIDPERFDRVNALLTRRNAKYKRSKKGEIDPRKDVPKKKTRWPGQHVDCGICGRLFRYGGHGLAAHLMCAGAYEYSCWNGITVNGPLAAEKLSAAILAEITALPDYDDILTDLMSKEIERIRSDHASLSSQLEQKGRTVDRELANIRASLRQAGPSNRAHRGAQRSREPARSDPRRDRGIGSSAKADDRHPAPSRGQDSRLACTDVAGLHVARVRPADAAADPAHSRLSVPTVRRWPPRPTAPDSRSTWWH